VKSGISLALVTNSSKRNTGSSKHPVFVQREPEAQVAYLFRKLSRMLRATRTNPDAKSVHQLRTTVRRIETLGASLGQLDEKAFTKFRNVLTEIFEKAGRVRDLDVQLEALQTISLPSVEDDKKVLQNYLHRQRSKRQRKLSETVAAELERRLPKRQRRAKAALLEGLKQDGESRRTIELRKEVLPFLDKLRIRDFDTQTLHELRLEVKHVRYAAEVAGEHGEAVVAILKPVQDAIGVWHDWINLIETADEVLGPLPGHPLMTILRSKVRARFNDAIAALKPLEAKLSDIFELAKRPGPVLMMREQAAAANAG
jgi:CHAD domain-containing protein